MYKVLNNPFKKWRHSQCDSFFGLPRHIPTRFYFQSRQLINIPPFRLIAGVNFLLYARCSIMRVVFTKSLGAALECLCATAFCLFITSVRSRCHCSLFLLHYSEPAVERCMRDFCQAGEKEGSALCS